MLVLGVFALCGLLALHSGDQLRYPDELDYSRLAQSLQAGKGYVTAEGQPTAYRPPGWPLVLSALYQISPHPVAAKLLNALALACAAWLLSILVARIAPEGRLFAPLLVLLYPLGWYTATTLYPQVFGTTLLCAILVLLTNGSHAAARYCTAGILLGFLILTIPAFLLVTPLLVAALFFQNRKTPGAFAGRAALCLLLAALVVAPWSLRNSRVLGGHILVSTNSGENLLLGNSENTGPNTGVNVDLAHYHAALTGMNEVEADARLTKFAEAWVLENPGAAAKLYLLKVLNYFNFRNEMHVKSEQSPLRNAIMFLSYYPLLLVSILRLAAHRRYPISSAEIALYLLYFGNAFVSAVFFTRIRFRVPFDMLLIGIAAIVLGLIVRTLKTSAARR